jgi:hypothetical protein
VLYPITLTASIFSMQPSVIPFGLTPGWLYISVFILVGAMSVIYWIMKKWGLWQKRIAVWMKQRQLEEDKRPALEGGHQNEVVFPASNIYCSVVAGDEENLGTRVLLGRKDNVQVLV